MEDSYELSGTEKRRLDDMFDQPEIKEYFDRTPQT